MQNQKQETSTLTQLEHVTKPKLGTESGANETTLERKKRSSNVCQNCRIRKIRCSRTWPCTNCLKSRRKIPCVYENESPITNERTQNDLSNSQNPPILLYQRSASQPIQFMNFNTANMGAKTSNGANSNKRKREETNDVSSTDPSTGSGTRGNSSSTTSSSKGESGSETSRPNKVLKPNDVDVDASLQELKALKEKLASIESTLSLAQPTLSNNLLNTGSDFRSSYGSLYGALTGSEFGFKSGSDAVLSFGRETMPPLSTAAPRLPNPPISQSPRFLQTRPVQPFGSPHPIGITSQPQFTTTQRLSNARDRSPGTAGIQLPPINFREQSSPHNSLSNASTETSHASPGYSPHSNMSNSKQKSLIDVNPYLNDTETINFYENYTSVLRKDFRRISYGPFAWSSLMNKDAALRALWKFIAKQKESSSFVFSPGSNEVTQENTQLVTSEPKESELHFKKTMLQKGGYADVVPYNILREKMKRDLNKEMLPLGLTLYEGQFSCELQLLVRIKQMLPKKKVVWKLIDRFFAWCYPFMPILDQHDFVEWVEKIIGPRSYEDVKIEDVKIERRLDLAIFGTLLVVMRLSYLSLFSNKLLVNEERLNSTDPSEKAQDTKYLMQNPIDINVVDIATSCLYQFDVLRRTSIFVLQLALFIKLYYMFAPEDGDDGEGADTNAMGGLVLQMAYSLGLNREPNKFSGELENKRMNHLGRKIWYLLMLSDVHSAYSYGSQMLISPDSYDTELPFNEEGNENLYDKELDRYVTNIWYGSGAKLNNHLKEILTLILSVKARIKVSDLCNLLTKYEAIFSQTFTSLKDCLVVKDPQKHIVARNFPAKYFISIKSFFVSVYFHLFLHYEHKDVQLSFFYLKKILKIAATEIMPHYFELMGNSEAICDMFINPKLQQIIHKSNQIFIAMIIRVNLSIYFLKSQLDHKDKCSADKQYYEYYRELCKFSSCLTRCAEVSIAAVSKLSTRYFYAWKLTKSHTFLLKVITTMDFYKHPAHLNSQNLRLPEFSTHQLSEMVEMCEVALRTLGKVSVQGHEFCDHVSCSLFKHQYSASSLSSAPESMGTSSTLHGQNSASESGDYSTPASNLSVDAKTFANEFGLDLVNSEEIDKIWLQMLSIKNDVKQQQPPQVASQSPFPSTSTNSGANAGDDVTIQPGTPYNGHNLTGWNRQPSNAGIHGSTLTASSQGQHDHLASHTGLTPMVIENPLTPGFSNALGTMGLGGYEDYGGLDFFADLPFDQMFNL